MIRSLRFRLAAGALVAIAVSLLATGFILGGAFTDYVVQRYRAEMSGVIDQVAAETSVRAGRLRMGRAIGDPRFQLPAGGRYWQVMPAAGEAVRSASLWDTVLTEEGGERPFGFNRARGPDGAPVLLVERALTLEGEGGRRDAIRVIAGFPESELSAALKDFHGTLWRMLLLTAAVLVAAAYLQGAIGLTPLTRLKQRVSMVRSGTASLIGEDGPVEVRPLVSEINLLLRERENAVERARARASDLAHGLKTPLTVLMQLADALPARERDLARQQVELVRQRADRQLQAARLGVEQMASTNLLSLAGKLVMVLSPVTRARSISWNLDIPADLAVQADAADVAECLGNLFDNAGKWAVSRIDIHAGPEEGGRMIRITIDDDGPGIPEEERSHFIERGRAGAAPAGGEGGSGLGLAISRDIATAYGGSLRLDRAPAGGLRVKLRLPCAAGP